MPQENSFLLVASHIRPWECSTGHERLDPGNGLSLCAIRDRAFEWGFLTVDDSRPDELTVIASAHAREHYEPDTRVQAAILSLDGGRLHHPRKPFQTPGAAYLEYHRQHVFERRFRSA